LDAAPFLPVTGGGSAPILALAAGFLLAGVATLVVRRRRLG
jgi:LPXTG-motif cell wall-anchored protein